MCVLAAQLCLTLCDPMDCSPPGPSIHEVLQARILEWVAISFSRGSSHSVVEAEGQDVWPNHGIHLKHLPTSYIIANFLPAKAGLWSKPSINGMGKYILTSSGGKCYKITCIVDVLMDVFFYHREGIRTGRNNTIYHIDKILTLCQAPRSAWQIITPLFVL